MNFASLVARAARRSPAATAVGDPAGTATYAQLADRAATTADALDRLGVDPGDRVGICLRNGLPFLTAHLGALWRGAVPLPVNTAFTDQQVRYVLETSDVEVLVTDGHREAVAGSVPSAVTVDGSAGRDLGELRAAASGDREVHPRRADEPAEVLYTSGTTGRPKGVRHTHGNLLANALGLERSLELTGDDVGLTACQCFHVTGLNVTTTPLLFAEAENRFLPEWDPGAALAAVEARGVTVTFLTPSMLIDLLDHEDLAAHDLSSLSRVGVGGAPMPTGRLREAERALSCPVLEGYGMTETAPLAAFTRLGGERKPGSVGRPAREAVALRIEDLETGEPVEPGERGELLWRGDTVTPGYERPQRDREAFVRRDGERWLRSGDVGWLDEDGHLHVVDRREDMFTTGCADVYPREIEEVLYELPGVSGAAVVDARDELRGAAVVAVLARADDSLTEARVREHCEAHLEAHEVPRHVEFVEELPTTATGKVDRVRLRETFGSPHTA